MTHWRTIASKANPHLHWWDIDGQTPLRVTIQSTTEGEVRDEEGTEKTMLFVRLAEVPKPLGLNVTNCYIIEAMHGGEIEGWAGKVITLRVAECRGEPCIRVETPRGLKLPKRIPRFRYTDSDRPASVPAVSPTPKPRMKDRELAEALRAGGCHSLADIDAITARLRDDNTIPPDGTLDDLADLAPESRDAILTDPAGFVQPATSPEQEN